ncbi:DUF3192 domain-containing protein [Shewanella cyperi]|uniref:DUF3192 domain-containing protein n=1 Tax=Shewanella cyperi TaxID=2814292 RepID=A0A974XVG1_9GAMM|nr:DUF3192 domain-containing protein [Shewanella cyperi]QSX31014.1 DUF3192 domain-containing protein [Shewanella cyperi]
MKPSAPVVIGGVFAAYLLFVGVAALGYKPTPDEMDWEDRQAYNQRQLTELNLGLDIDEVRQIMGKANFSEAKNTEGAQLQVLFYRTHHEKSDGETTKDECTPLLFKDNKLIAWGDDSYQLFQAAPIAKVL